jgi:hypothetical protein
VIDVPSWLVAGDQDPFAVLAGLDPTTPWKAAADRWSEWALQSLREGKELEISFRDSFLRSIVGSTGLVLWNRKDNSPSADPGLALLRENRVERNPESGLNRLYIPGNSISYLSARAFTESRQPLVGGEHVLIKRRTIDLNAKTGVDKRLFVFSPEFKLRPIEAGGSWFRLPLEEVRLALV